MRGYLFLKAASADFRVETLVVPVAGDSRPVAAGPVTVLPLPDARQVAAALPGLLASACWRERFSAACPLPPLASLAPATLADAAQQVLRARPGTPVHVARSYLAPLGIALAERIGSAWTTLDLDDDDEQLERSAGNEAAAAAYGRLVGVFGPLFRAVALAAPAEAAAIAARHGLAASVLPNAVALAERPSQPDAATEQAGVPAREIRLLFVGNLTYWPNADAASRLVREILPALRQATSRPVRVTLAGQAGADLQLRRLAAVPGVELTGFTPDLGPVYRGADVLVAPLAFGAGTRIKLLEAFAYGLPVVTTSRGAAGLDVASGRQLLIADTTGELARAVLRIAGDGVLASQLAAAAYDLVRRKYSQQAVIPQIRAFLAAARRATVPVPLAARQS